MAYTAITSGEVDEDSPITEGLMQKIRNNLVYFLARFDTSTGHEHNNGTDDGAPITTFPEHVTAGEDVTVEGLLTADNFTNYLALFGAF